MEPVERKSNRPPRPAAGQARPQTESAGSDITRGQSPRPGHSAGFCGRSGSACFGAGCQMFLGPAVTTWRSTRPAGAAGSAGPRLAPLAVVPHVSLLWDVFGGFPASPVMCAAADGGLAMLILLCGSGKYPSSLRRRRTTKSRGCSLRGPALPP